ncbi:MAG: CPBP family intramembrane metalloprotease [Spirochaetales bacterium]|nr:CPBP family intramembrane metalloprotease [Spirochaetales bacterium]
MKKYVKMFAFITLYSVVYFAIIKGAGFLYSEFLIKLPVIGNYLNNNLPMFHIFQDCFQVPAYILIFYLIKRKNLFTVCNFSRISIRTMLVIGVIGFGSSLFTTSLFQMPWVREGIPQLSGLLNDRLLAQNPVQFIFWVFLHAALYREILFRGMIFNEFKEVLPVTIALILQALWQGFLFFNFLSIPLVAYGFISCILFGLIYLWCKSLWASILGQVAIDVFLYIWRLTGNSIFNEATAPFILGAGMLIVVSALFYLKEFEESGHTLKESPGKE